MKKHIFILILLIIVWPAVAQNNSNLREQLKQYVAELQKNPSDQALREKIIELALTLDPIPAIPEDAKRYLARGLAAAEEAKEAKDFKDAAAEFEKASLAAPWLGEPYRALGIVQDNAGDYAAAIGNLKLYLLTEPETGQAEKAKELIYKIEFKQEKERNKPREATLGVVGVTTAHRDTIEDAGGGRRSI
jgi:tetratricopeptide (TPR) repeat protein